MKRIKEILKSLLVVLFWTVVAIDTMLILGEDDGNMSITRFVLIKAAALAAAYALYRIGKYAWNKGLVPDWYVRYTEALTQED